MATQNPSETVDSSSSEKVPAKGWNVDETLKFQRYSPENKIRIVTATALFDGHDASINIMRRLLQSRGAELIHLGHNRSAQEIADAAIEEDAHAVAISSYQGGHVEFFKYVRDLLNAKGGDDIGIFGGGGGVITPQEIAELESYGISKIYSPEDGQCLGLDGIIGHILARSDRSLTSWGKRLDNPISRIGRALTLLENKSLSAAEVHEVCGIKSKDRNVPIVGITGTGGSGKSSLTDELLTRFLFDMPKVKIAILCIDPSKKKTGGALLGDRIRMNSASDSRIFIRSLATRGSGSEISAATKEAAEILAGLDFDFVAVETSGIGQGNANILEISDISLYVMTPEYGAQTQLEKIDMLDYADLVAINKFERRGALDAIRDVRTQMRRSRFHGERLAEADYPVFGTIASRFEDDGTNGLYKALCAKLNSKIGRNHFYPHTNRHYAQESGNRESLIPGERLGYLSEVARTVRSYHSITDKQATYTSEAESLDNAMVSLAKRGSEDLAQAIEPHALAAWDRVYPDLRAELSKWPGLREKYASETFSYEVRGRNVNVSSRFRTLAELSLPKVALPKTQSKGEILRFLRSENVPGEFPYTAGLFPFRRTAEDPKRQFAGEGGPDRTNARFHYLSKNDEAKRLSTAFDSVTLYGSEPHQRPDIYGKVGESGVSIATLDDMKALYSGFDLCHPLTSVSMTINGPAPMILAMFLNTAIDQQLQVFSQKYGRPLDNDEVIKITEETLSVVRGTVQADILKEDQAQNTCIFSTEFALKMMGDIQSYFIEKRVRNYYSVSISGYHIAEAGANPITQLAMTLANGFTYVEYYLARGMIINDFVPNLSFFFSNGIDPEYAVIGRVARRIWSIAMRDLYHADERSQKLKYHIQTSGRSLHAQEIDFNDIRTTLQALMAIYDNCNSLHTNAYDEAITTPTEDSVRRAMAIQMIINQEFGLNKCENVNQGSYIIEQLTDLVEEAVLIEFDRLTARGGVLGAMESQYQRSKIQEESLRYETLKDSGELPIIGVNTFQSPKVLSGNYERPEIALIRASYTEKNAQIARLNSFKARHIDDRDAALERLAEAVLQNRNVFAELMHTVRFASLGEITEALFRVGGKYRRAM